MTIIYIPYGYATDRRTNFRSMNPQNIWSRRSSFYSRYISSNHEHRPTQQQVNSSRPREQHKRTEKRQTFHKRPRNPPIDPSSVETPHFNIAFPFSFFFMVAAGQARPSSPHTSLSLETTTCSRSKPWGRFTDRWLVPVR